MKKGKENRRKTPGPGYGRATRQRTKQRGETHRLLSPPLLLILFFLWNSSLISGPASGSSTARSPLKEGNRKNILLITIDTLRADSLGCYGCTDTKTPNIDGLAERGTLFSRAFANTPTTLPSHTNILLGTTPLFHGVHENLNFKVNEELLTLAEHLRSFGYSTGAFVGAYPLDSRFGLSQGFDVYDDNFSRAHSMDPSSIERNAEAVMESALEWLNRQNSPWFLWVHCWDPHIPYEPPEPYKSRYGDNPYYGEVAYVDSVLGQLIEALETGDVRDETIVFFTGDHGESLGQHGEKTHGYFAYNTTLWIPLIVAVPGGKAVRNDQKVSHIDIFPTVCDLLDLETPSRLQGLSLLPALTGGKLAARPVYFESLFPYYSKGWAPIRGFILGNQKFIDSPIPELFDLDDDFDEGKNIASEKKSAALKMRLKKIMGDLTPAHTVEAKQSLDRRALEKLGSLGYISNIGVEQKKTFGPRDDVKVMLPFIHRSTEAFDLHLAGKTAEGVKLLSEIIEERKDIDTAYMRLADIYKETGQADEALKILQDGFLQLPSSYEIFLDNMKLLVDTGGIEKAIELFESARFRETELDPEAWNILGIAYSKKGDFSTAVRAFEQGLSIDGRDPELHNNLGNATYSYGIQEESPSIFQNCLEHYKKAIEIDPDYATPYFGLGQAYQQMGRLGDAVFCWEKALAINPDFPRAHRALALVHLTLGNKTKALEMLEDFKTRYYHLMPPAERLKLDNLMKECRR